MYVVSTAGHVDHGKSTLINALTGIDPDRLSEEHRRGLTIELGFAWLTLPSGREVGIVDVPGHERFIKNMLAGVGSINAAIFVVAANEGWKPQSQEHLEILDLLGVRSAVVALTKIDSIDPTEQPAVEARIRKHLLGTCLEEAPIVGVSATTNTGLAELRLAIDAILLTTLPPPDDDRPRLWIDRVFTMKGAGTVVTGTLTGGSLRKDEVIETLPNGIKARIRSLQTHRREVDAIGPGNRVALNLVGVENDRLERGHTIVAPTSWEVVGRLLADVRFLPSFDTKSKGAFKFYVGSAASDAKLRISDDGLSLITLQDPLPLVFGDRFILRESGRRQTIGGGRVIETKAPFQNGASRAAATTKLEYLGVLLGEGQILPMKGLEARLGLSIEKARTLEAVWLGSFVLSESTLASIASQTTEVLERFHRVSPLEPGMMRSALNVEQDILEELLRREIIVSRSGYITMPSHKVQTQGPEQTALLEYLEASGASPNTLPELHTTFDPGLIRSMIRSGSLVQISDQLVYTAHWIEDLKKIVAKQVTNQGPFTVADFRDMIKTTRKYAIPLLEYLDSLGFTVRSGDKRTLRSPEP
ncbi:MAG: selenocysteine-specific translation elongation factor [Actinomycetota bacterium]